MEYPISDKMAVLKPSVIREIFKYATDSSVISLAAGDPAPEALPAEDIKTLMGVIMAQDLRTALLYSQSEGHPPLRQALKAYAAETHGIVKESDDLIITSGAQQCMDLVCKVLCNEGDTVICETPSFIGSLNCFRSYNVNLVGVPMQDDGMDIEQLELALKAHTNTRFIYTIPNFQNPTGITMSLAKRKAVYALAKQYGVLVLEDNPYGDLRFAGEALPAIKSMDEDGLVVYAGTFSKILSSGIRLGYLIAPSALIGKLVVAKQCADVHTSMLPQLLALRFLEQCDIAAHIRKLSKVYDRKCNLMLGEMDKLFPKSVTYTRPQGGLFIWATLPDGMDSTEFATRLIKEKKIAIVPGSAFSVRDGEKSSAFRLNFSTPSEENIVRGITVIADMLREYKL